MPIVMANQAMRIQQQMQMYMSGAMPIHFLAEANSALFLELVFDVPRRNASGADLPAPIMAMHGSRPTLYAARELSSATTLYLDLTTLVLAYTIGSLDAIFRSGKALVVSRHLIQALININLFLFAHQERLITAVKTIAELPVTTNKSARPLSIEAPGGSQYSGESLQSFLLASAEAGIISGEKWEAARDALQIAAAAEAAALPPARRSEVVLGTDSATFLARFSLIAPLSLAFKLGVTSEARKWIEQKLVEFGQEAERKSWLRSLIDALSRAIMDGRLCLTPEPADDATQIDASIRSAGLVIMDLIRQPKQERATSAIAFDDRFLNRSDRTGNGIPVVSIGEVLGMLRNAGIISREEHREMLTRVREMLICFFPLSADEIVEAVMECKLDSNGNLFEARALAAIRKYLERTFEISNVAQLGPGLTNRLDESFYFKSAIESLRLAKARVAHSLAPAPKLRYIEGLERACRLRLTARVPWLQI